MLFSGLGFQIVYLIIALIVGLTFHEASHALVATLLGDPSPKNAGRLSLNPLAHLDPLGTLMILFVGFGFAKPVQIDAEKLSPGPKIGMALVAIAGPISNLLIAVVLAIPLRLHLISYTPIPFQFGQFTFGVTPACICDTIVSLSLALAIINLIPISPLDGSRLWQILLPDKIYMRYVRYEILGLLLIFGIILADTVLNTGILARIIFPPLQAIWTSLVGFSHPYSCIIR